MVYVRDRTNLFVSYRQSYTHHPYQVSDAANHPLMDDGTEAIEMEEMPPQWLDLTSQLDMALSQIRAQIAQLQPLHKQNSLPGFDDRTKVDKQIEVLTVAITRGLHRCQALVKSFSEIAKLQREQHLAKLATNIQIAMAAKLQDCSTRFRQMQSTYLKALKQEELGDLPGMNLATASVEDDVALSRMALQQQEGQQQGGFADAEVLQREQDIGRVADTILEVADIFRDLQTMVIDQGAMIDRIDYNLENTLVHVKNADKQLVQGERYQKRTQKCYVILLLILIVVGLVLVLIFKPHEHVTYEEHRVIEVPTTTTTTSSTPPSTSTPTPEATT